jgi:hypothetical protein
VDYFFLIDILLSPAPSSATVPKVVWPSKKFLDVSIQEVQPYSDGISLEQPKSGIERNKEDRGNYSQV